MFSFDLMFNELARPLTVKIPTGDGQKRDDSGFPVADASTVVKHVSEPLVTNTNPSVTFDNATGGQTSVNELVWQSKAVKDAPRGTTVIDSSGNQYKVTGIAHANRSDYTIYQVKAVNGH